MRFSFYPKLCKATAPVATLIPRQAMRLPYNGDSRRRKNFFARAGKLA